jgi:cytochrome c biogenesis factor
LGGIWADQSWGRFWGWDPKENGALLIVLWLIWVLHAKLSGDLNRILMLAALSFTSVIVALAWIGVNLLGVGLHSYGFTEGLFWGLGIFVAFEIILITYLSLRSNQQEKRFHA